MEDNKKNSSIGEETGRIRPDHIPDTEQTADDCNSDMSILDLAGYSDSHNGIDNPEE